MDFSKGSLNFSPIKENIITMSDCPENHMSTKCKVCELRVILILQTVLTESSPQC